MSFQPFLSPRFLIWDFHRMLKIPRKHLHRNCRQNPTLMSVADFRIVHIWSFLGQFWAKKGHYLGQFGPNFEEMPIFARN